MKFDHLSILTLLVSGNAVHGLRDLRKKKDKCPDDNGYEVWQQRDNELVDLTLETVVNTNAGTYSLELSWIPADVSGTLTC